MSLPDRLAKFFLVKEDEYYPTAYFLVLFLLVGAGLAIGRGSADTLFFKRYGVEYLPVMYISFGILLSGISAMYAAFADRITSEKFFVLIISSTVALLLVCWFLISVLQWSNAYPLYYLVYEVASELLVIHAFLYVNQNFETMQAKRLTPLIFAAAQSGKIIGGLVLAFASPVIGVQNFILIWAGLMFIALILIIFRHRQSGVSPYYRSGKKGRKGLVYSIDQIVQGVQFAKRSRLLKYLSFALFFIVTGFYIVTYAVNSIYSETFSTEESLSTFFGLLTVVNGVIALLIQAFLTSKLLRTFGIKKINLVFPVTTITSYLFLIVSFTFPIALFASFNKEVIMTAIRNPTRNLFFNALPDYMQGRARALSLVIVLPISLVITGGLLVFMQSMGDSSIYLYVGLFSVILYLYFSLKINSAYVSAILSTLRARVFIPEGVNAGSTELVNQLKIGVMQENSDISVSYAKLLAKEYPDQVLQVVLERMRTADHPLSDRLLKLIIEIDRQEMDKELWEILEDSDNHLKATIYFLLFNQKNTRVLADVESCVNSKNPRLCSVGIYGVYQYKLVALEPIAKEKLRSLLENKNSNAVLAGLQLLEYCYLKEYGPVLKTLLQHDSQKIIKAVLRVLYIWPVITSDAESSLLKNLLLYDDPEIRMLAVDCFVHLPAAVVEDSVLIMLEDSHPRARECAINVLLKVSGNPASLLFGWIIKNQGTPRAQQSALSGLGLILPDVALYIRIAEAKVDDALKCRAAINVISGDQALSPGAAMQLLRTILAERIQQFVDLSLAALEHVEDKTTIDIIRAGLKSSDNRQLANACEVMRHLKNRHISKLLGQIYEGEIIKTKKETMFSDFKDVIHWCTRRQDPWIQIVAKEVVLS
ncbi:MAG: hypothetical protein ACC635_00065 [Acidiferrobacterales bacterium]